MRHRPTRADRARLGPVLRRKTGAASLLRLPRAGLLHNEQAYVFAERGGLADSPPLFDAILYLLTFSLLHLILNNKEIRVMIKQFRAVWHNEPINVPTETDDDRDVQFGPRSAGKVARWSL